MKKLNHNWLIVLIIVAITVASCNSERRASKGCGCGVHKGYVGY